MTTPPGLSIVDVGRHLRGLGLDIGEHKECGGVTGGHAPNSYHYHGEAIDVRDWRPDVAPEFEGGPKLHWKERTARMRDRARQLGIFNEALGPGDKGHDTHLHLALRGTRPITQQQLEFLGTGRWRGADGSFLTAVPGADGAAPAVAAAPAASAPAPAASPAGDGDADFAAAFDIATSGGQAPLTPVAMSTGLLEQAQAAATQLQRQPRVQPQEQRRLVDPYEILKMVGVSL